jgi:hypothetical protein
MKVTRLVSLAAIGLVTLACTGLSPTAPALPTSSDDPGVLNAQSLGDPSCKLITEVKLRNIGDLIHDPLIQASYFVKGLPAKCGIGPVWTARPAARLVPTDDPFVVKVLRTKPATYVKLQATAPSGATLTIQVK